MLSPAPTLCPSSHSWMLCLPWLLRLPIPSSAGDFGAVCVCDFWASPVLPFARPPLEHLKHLDGVWGAQERWWAVCEVREVPNALSMESEAPPAPHPRTPSPALTPQTGVFGWSSALPGPAPAPRMDTPAARDTLKVLQVLPCCFGSIPSFTGAWGLSLSSPAPDFSPGLSLRPQSHGFPFHIRNRSLIVSSPIAFHSLSAVCISQGW